jgi:anti-sigma-K factor RskA
VPDLAAAPRRSSPSFSGAYGWLAAAACLVVAVVAWNRQPAAPPVALELPPARVLVPPPAPTLPAPPTPAEERAQLLTRSEALKVTLGATKDPAAAGLRGDVVWDQSTQRGFVRFVGLAPNDPALRQYQLWIFDGGRDQRYPVDGGVFDIPANSSEVVIPIHAALQVISPKAFAVTVEKPGGVVVSGREHVVALGAAG